MENAQDIYDQTPSGNLTLPPGEYQGPLTIRRPCEVDGSFSTLFAAQGPVLLVQSAGVTIKNLRVEMTGSAQDQGVPMVIRTDFPDTKLMSVEVNGDLQGFPGEPTPWKLPSLISLGEFAADTPNSFSIELEAPGEAAILNEIRDITVEPMCLKRGMNTLYIQTDSIRNNTILYGELLIRSTVTRRLHLMGKALTGVAPQQAARKLVSDAAEDARPVQVDPLREAVPPLVTEANVPDMQRGQRFALQGVNTGVLKMLLEYTSANRSLTVDGYTFLLQMNGKVACDNDLIFFGNSAATDQAIRCSSVNNQPLLIAELAKLPPSVEKVTVCYAVYGDQPQENFSLVQNPLLRLFAGEKELCRFRPDGLSAEKAVVAAEFYRYKGEWKINFIGAGYQGGLKQLCTGYGVNVE